VIPDQVHGLFEMLGQRSSVPLERLAHLISRSLPIKRWSPTIEATPCSSFVYLKEKLRISCPLPISRCRLVLHPCFRLCSNAVFIEFYTNRSCCFKNQIWGTLSGFSLQSVPRLIKSMHRVIFIDALRSSVIMLLKNALINLLICLYCILNLVKANNDSLQEKKFDLSTFKTKSRILRVGYWNLGRSKHSANLFSNLLAERRINDTLTFSW
jgi:hypothetical protein